MSQSLLFRETDKIPQVTVSAYKVKDRIFKSTDSRMHQSSLKNILAQVIVLRHYDK